MCSHIVLYSLMSLRIWGIGIEEFVFLSSTLFSIFARQICENIPEMFSPPTPAELPPPPILYSPLVCYFWLSSNLQFFSFNTYYLFAKSIISNQLR